MNIVHYVALGPMNPGTNISSPSVDISEPTFAVQSNRWCSLTIDMIVERSCLEEGIPPRWEVRRVTDTLKGAVIAAILEHLGWDDVVILTDGGIDGKLVRVCALDDLHINLRRSRDGTFVRGGRLSGVLSSIRPAVGFIQFALGSFYADCPHKRII